MSASVVAPRNMNTTTAYTLRGMPPFLHWLIIGWRAYRTCEFTLSSTTDEEKLMRTTGNQTHGSHCHIVYGSTVCTTKHLHELFGGAWNELVLRKAISHRRIVTVNGMNGVRTLTLATMHGKRCIPTCSTEYMEVNCM